VDDGLGLLELRDGQGTAQAADAALLEAALGEAVVDRGPGVRPDGAGVDLAADPAADVDVAGEDAGRQAEFGGVGAGDGVVSRILAKLGLADRTQAAIFALQHHVVPLDRPVSAAVVSTVLRSCMMILLVAQMGAASALIEAVINAVGSVCGVAGVFSHSPSCHELWTTIRQRS
jgi:hypothetical protein